MFRIWNLILISYLYNISIYLYNIYREILFNFKDVQRLWDLFIHPVYRKIKNRNTLWILNSIDESSRSRIDTRGWILVRGKNIQSTWLHFTPNFSRILCWIFFVLNLMRATCHLSHRSWEFSPRLQRLTSYIDLYWYSYETSFIISHFCKNRSLLRLRNKILKTIDLEYNIRSITIIIIF